MEEGGGNNGGIHDRSLFQNETSFHKCGNHLREQLLLQSVLEQQIAKTTKGISVRNLITGIDAAEIRKRTAGSGIAIPSTGHPFDLSQKLFLFCPHLRQLIAECGNRHLLIHNAIIISHPAVPGTFCAVLP